MSDRLAGVAVAVLGSGNQGEAQALNLRDSVVDVIVGARPTVGGAMARATGHPIEAARISALGAGPGAAGGGGESRKALSKN